MKRKIILCFAVFTAVFAILPIIASASSGGGYDHHMDTREYCMQANNATIGLVELERFNNSDEMFEHIVNLIDPSVRILNSDDGCGEWILLARSDLIFDFSAIKKEPSEEGYPVTITAPPIYSQETSQLLVYVYVKDDRPPRQFATISFSGTDIPDLTVDITEGGAEVLMSDFPVIERKGFDFCGWFLDPELSRPFLLPDSREYSSQTIQGDVTVYPKLMELMVPVSTDQPEIPEEPVQDEGMQYQESPPVFIGETTMPEQIRPEKINKQNNNTTETKKDTKYSSLTTIKKEDQKEKNKTEHFYWVDRVLRYAVCICLLAVWGGLCFSIKSDLYVLRWYKKKKKGLDKNVRKCFDRDRGSVSGGIEYSVHLDKTVSAAATEGH